MSRGSGRLCACLLAMTVASSMWLHVAQARTPIARQAKQLSNRAALLFKRGDFVVAAEFFERAYALDPQVSIRLRNAGRAYEEGKRIARALHCFKRYLTLCDEPKLIEDVKGRIARLHRELNAKDYSQDAAPTTSASKTTLSTKMPSQKVKSGHQSMLESTKPRPQINSTKPSVAWKVGSLAAGLIGLGGGVYWLLRTGSAEAEIDDGVASGSYNYDGGASKLIKDQDTVRINRAFAGVVSALGAASLGVSLWLWLRRDSQSNVTSKVTWTPVGPNGLPGASASYLF